MFGALIERNNKRPTLAMHRLFVPIFLVTVIISLASCGGTASNVNTSTHHPSNTGTILPTPSPTKMPDFPWPPKASTFTKIPSTYLAEAGHPTTLKGVADRLENAFGNAGYKQVGYYSIPNGFALVSRLEQFKPNGLPADENYRWLEEIEPPKFFSLDYLIALIAGKTGRFRVIVFAVSPDLFVQAEGKKVESNQAGTLAIQGANKLPKEVGDLPFTNEYICTGLVYEFERQGSEKTAQFKENSTLLAEDHLRQILIHLER